MADFITTGTITATNASTAITGSGTAFVTDGLKAGDVLWIIDASTAVAYPIASVASATSLTLQTAYKGSTASGKTYVGMRRFDEESAADTYRLLNTYVAALNDGTFVASYITAAASKTTPVDADTVLITDSAASSVLKKTTFANLWTWVQAKFAAASSKTTPVDADSLYLVDSAASNVAKRLTFANLKTWLWGISREKLTANRFYYVRTDGSNSNNGLSNTAGGAFLTIQYALDFVAANLDFSIYTVTIQVDAGTFTEKLTVPSCVGQASTGQLYLLGAGIGSTIVTTNAAYEGALNAGSGAKIYTEAITFVNSNANGYSVNAVFGGQIFLATVGINAGSNANAVVCRGVGSFVAIYSALTFGTNCNAAFFACFGGFIQIEGVTVTYGTRTFSGATAIVSDNGILLHGNVTNSGTVTGSRYSAYMGGVIQTYGGGASAIAGNSAGSTATGGQYA